MTLSLKTRLVLTALVVEVAVFLLLIFNSVRLTDEALQGQGRARLAETSHLLSAALGPLLVQQDLATTRDLVHELKLSNDLTYISVMDSTGRVLVQAGQPGSVLATETPIIVAGERYGWVRFGLSERFLREARTQLLHQNLAIALFALLGTAMVLTILGYWVARRFDALIAASKRIAAGDFATEVAVSSRDELGQLERAFAAMTAAVREHLQRAREDEERFHAIADYTYDLELWYSAEGRLQWVNPSVERLLGLSVAKCLAMKDFPLPLIHPEDRLSAEFQLRQALRGGSGAGYTCRLTRKDGKSFWVIVNWQPIYDGAGHYQGIRASIHDIDELKAVEASLKDAITDLRLAESLQLRYLEDSEQERARLVSLLSAMTLGILFVGADGRVTYHNPAFNRIWMIGEEAPLIGLPVNEVLGHSTSVLARPDHFSKHLLSVLETREVSDSFEIQMTDGRVVTELDYPVRDKEGGFIGHLWIYEDVTRERQTAAQLVYLAERDALTGLYNRHRFQEELSRMLLDTERSNCRCALMFFDLDEFKAVNDNFGHRAGDALLIRVAGEIGGLIRRNEIFARLGGDEFAVLLPTVRDGEAEALAERIVRAVGQIPFRFEGQNIRLTASLGIAYFPGQSQDADDLVAKADIAMYQAKEAGKNTWRVYRAPAEQGGEPLSRLTWNERISHALEQGLFQLHFQGIYRIGDGALSHLEALIRMRDEKDPARLIMPSHFIPVAEKSGRILDIDRWVIATAIDVLAQHPQVPGIAVNLSARSLGEASLPQFIVDSLRERGVAPARFIVELTETDAVADLQDAQRFIEALRNHGCTVCLDDFGTGFASFAYLKHIRADTIKIDGVFIRDLYADPDNQVFVRAIVQVARGLKKTVVAEYVEEARTLALLKDFGVDLVQGYHLDKPTAEHPVLRQG